MQTAPQFDLIPADQLAIDQPTFKASAWKRNNSKHSRFQEYSECYEWVGGKWEGFVSVREAA
jgi:hypothetical protein